MGAKIYRCVILRLHGRRKRHIAPDEKIPPSPSPFSRAWVMAAKGGKGWSGGQKKIERQKNVLRCCKERAKNASTCRSLSLSLSFSGKCRTKKESARCDDANSLFSCKRTRERKRRRKSQQKRRGEEGGGAISLFTSAVKTNSPTCSYYKCVLQ